MSIFTDVYVKAPKRSRIPLSHKVSMTTDFGKLTPILAIDCVPGDVFKLKSAVTIQTMPLLAPVLDNIEVRVDYFFVPNRLLWDSWSDFITAGPNGLDHPIHPYVLNSQVGFAADPKTGDIDPTNGIGSIADYFGLPVNIPGSQSPTGEDKVVSDNEHFNALPFRAYRKIWNEYYRDQNLQEEATEFTGSGHDVHEKYDIYYRGVKKDYFTSALPWAQRGPQVTIPLGDRAPVKAGAAPESERFYNGGIASNNSYHSFDTVSNVGDIKPLDFEVNSAYSTQYGREVSGPLVYYPSSDPRNNILFHNHDIAPQALLDSAINNSPDGFVYADLSASSGISINELRRLTAVQKWLEVNARGGARYIEQILAHFGVRTPDFRLDRPEYLGGTKSQILINKVTQTSATEASSPLGNFAGDGVMASLNSARKYRCDEHGWIIGIMSILPYNTYMEGIPRAFSRSDVFDYYFPEFQHLGEQAILNKELYGYYDQFFNPDGIFGYAPRYSEYKFMPNRLAGNLRGNMAYWSTGRFFGYEPALGPYFINTAYWREQYDRIFGTTDMTDNFVVSIYNKVDAKRPMKRHVNPSL